MTVDLVSSDDGARKIYARSRMSVVFMLWAVAMRCFRQL
jgi:hypothetical protein